MVVTWLLGRQITSFVCLSVGDLGWVYVPSNQLTTVALVPVSAPGDIHSLQAFPSDFPGLGVSRAQLKPQSL